MDPPDILAQFLPYSLVLDFAEGKLNERAGGIKKNQDNQSDNVLKTLSEENSPVNEKTRIILLQEAPTYDESNVEEEEEEM